MADVLAGPAAGAVSVFFLYPPAPLHIQLAGAPAGAFAFLFQSLPPTLHIETAAASMNSANSAFTSSTSRVSVYRERESSIGNRAASQRGGGAQDTEPRA